MVGYQFSKATLGGGYPVVTKVQGKEHVGSIGCLVTDGVRYFALTNQHVAGEAGSEIFTLLQGDGRRIGTSARRSVRSEPFQKLFPGFPGSSTRGNLDIGLIDVDDLADWTAQVFGLGVLGPLAEFNAHTASLDWIGTPAAAHGAHSGDLRGEIKALFYRYRTIGGVDYVSDFLLGGVGDEPLKTMPGIQERSGASSRHGAVGQRGNDLQAIQAWTRAEKRAHRASFTVPSRSNGAGRS